MWDVRLMLSFVTNLQDQLEMCNIPQIWVLTHANLNSLSRGLEIAQFVFATWACEQKSRSVLVLWDAYPRGERKLRDFKTPTQGVQVGMREYSNLGNVAHFF